jgi:hypothetical protein
MCITQGNCSTVTGPSDDQGLSSKADSKTKKQIMGYWPAELIFAMLD